MMTAEFGAHTQLEKIEMLDVADLVVLNKYEKRAVKMHCVLFASRFAATETSSMSKTTNCQLLLQLLANSPTLALMSYGRSWLQWLGLRLVSRWV